jgi:hypothetical protein
MKLAIIGSRNIMNLSGEIPKCSTIVSGGAKGIDQAAQEYADKNNIPFEIHLPDYKKYGNAAPLIRNRKIVDASDYLLIFWDGKSRGTKSVIDYCEKKTKPYEIRKI